MDAATAAWLVSPDAAPALALAASFADPGSLAAATALRASWPPARAAAAAEQAVLRRRARTKAGALAADIFWITIELQNTKTVL